MARKRYFDEDVLKLLREIDVHLHDGSRSPDLPRVRCFEDFDATALLNAKSDGSVAVDTAVPASNKPDRFGWG
jgi:hypothetical protein